MAKAKISDEIYIAVIQAASNLIGSSNYNVEDKISHLPKAFKSLIDEVQKHKDARLNQTSNN